MLGIAIMLSNFFHDFAVAMFTCAVIGRGELWRFAAQAGEGATAVVEALDRFAMKVTSVSLGGIIVLGAVRLWAFMDYEWNPALGRGQIPALGAKHMVLSALLAWGFYKSIKGRARTKAAAPNATPGA